MTAFNRVRARIGQGKIYKAHDHRVEDYGVIYARSGLHLTPVIGPPSIGQYSICRGAYIFADGEDGRRTVLLYYRAP
jgi:hypothetical protein